MTADLRRVSRAARKAALSREQFEQAIRDASASGASTRVIAYAAGLSHQRIWQILRGE